MTNDQWAMQMIPVLIHWAQNSWETPHYYSELSNAVGHKTSQIGGILGSIHDIMDDLAKKHNMTIPTLNCLVCNKSNKLPSSGFSYVVANYDHYSEDKQISEYDKLRQLAHDYDWDWVLSTLGLEPYNPSVSYWLVPSNSTKFNLHGYLINHSIVDWKQFNNYAEGDIVFMYCTRPDSKVRYMFRVIRTELTSEDYQNDKSFWEDEAQFQSGQEHNRYIRLRLLSKLNRKDERLSLEVLKGLGFSTFQGASKIKEQVTIDYFLNIFSAASDLDPDILDTTKETFFEGAKRQVTVNNYERDQQARQQCIKIHGAACAVCGIDFGKIYGELGKGFIHVHHKVPIHTIGEGYQINPSTDLVPVCPNCHAMLHRGMNGEARSIEELKNIIKQD